MPKQSTRLSKIIGLCPIKLEKRRKVSQKSHYVRKLIRLAATLATVYTKSASAYPASILPVPRKLAILKV